MLEERRDDILRILVEEYIRSGEPVSSRTVCEVGDLGVSTATVRAELAALERDGYVAQPHTSAGRVPTSKAYRYYVDHLGPTQLRAGTQTKIANFFDTVHLELAKLLKATSQLLADITDLPAVVVAPGVAGEKVRDVHLVQLTSEVILAMVVTEGGRVIQDRVRLDRPISPAELSEVERAMSGAIVGTRIGSSVSGDALRAQVGAAAADVAIEVMSVIARAAAAESDVYLGGTRRMASVWEDLSEVRRVLEVVEREAMVLNILARAPGTSIRIGAELPVTDVELAVVSTTYDTGALPGSVGVIGPMRMNYGKVISAVEEVSRELEDWIQR